MTFPLSCTTVLMLSPIMGTQLLSLETQVSHLSPLDRGRTSLRGTCSMLRLSTAGNVSACQEGFGNQTDFG